MDSVNIDNKTKFKHLLKDAINDEIENSEELMELLKTDVEFISLTDQGETPLVYGNNLKELLSLRIKLMIKHINDEPFIDHDYMERQACQFAQETDMPL